MPERTGYLGLGSNVGDSEGHLRAALQLLPTEGVQILAVSSTWVTEPVGEILDQPDFLNAAVRVRTALEPEELLDACKRVEAERGRHFDLPRHSPRPLDVDLLLLDEIELVTDRLTLPHPQVRNRRFVLAPLLELDPEPDPARRHRPRRRPRRPARRRAARREPRPARVGGRRSA